MSIVYGVLKKWIYMKVLLASIQKENKNDEKKIFSSYVVLSIQGFILALNIFHIP